MSDKIEEIKDKTVKEFEIKDFDKGTFYLLDNVFDKQRSWRISDRSKTGLMMLMQGAESKLPEDQKALKDRVKGMSDKELDEYLRELSRASRKQIAILASFLEVEEDIPEIFENKIEFLAACITEDSAVKIYAFFLMHSTNGTMFREEIEREMRKILNDESTKSGNN